jgi:ATP-binding cassette subfamily B protein
MTGISLILLIWYGGSLVLRGNLSIGDLTAFTGYLAALGWPVMSVGWAANLFQRGKAGQLRIRQLMSSEEAALPSVESAVTHHGAVPIEADSLELRFESGRGLGPLSLSVPAGGSLAILGGIGSGKTILLQLLAGIREPQKGVISIGGQPMTRDRLRGHWASLGWTPQESALFSGSLRENFNLGNPDANEAEMWDAARVVCLDDLIRRLPDGLDTVVGERGVILSGGERQRAALARALLRKPGVLLMDVSLSAVDAETESRILKNLGVYLGKITLILATHRVFVAELCENAIVLEHGKLIQSGAPNELANVAGAYAKIRRLQSMERQRQ